MSKCFNEVHPSNISSILVTFSTLKLERFSSSKEEQYLKIELIKPGVEWFSIKDNIFDVIVDGEKELRFEVLKVIERVVNEISVAIPEKMILRDDKTNLFQISFLFSEQSLLQINIADKGFGEFYESSLATTSRVVEI